MRVRERLGHTRQHGGRASSMVPSLPCQAAAASSQKDLHMRLLLSYLQQTGQVREGEDILHRHENSP